MVNVHRRIRNLVCALAVLAIGTGTAAAQSYPNRPIRFVVGFSAGGITDIVARIVADHVRARLGQPVTVENRTGANGMVAAVEVARSAPDGHTVLISNSSTLTLNPLLHKKIQYQTADFAPVALMVSYPFIVAINPASPKMASVNTLADLVRLARDKPGQFTYGSSGLGGLVHLGFEWLNQLAEVRMVHVPYRGASAAQVALLGNEVDVVFENPTSLPQFKSGRLKALAVTSPERWRDLPDVSAVAEGAGYAGFDSSSWVGAVVPARTPPDVVRALSDAIRSAGDDPAMRALLQQHGNLPMLDPQQFAAKIRAETETNAKVIERASITVD